MKKFLTTVAASLLLSSAALAQNFPTKPIKMIVPFPPGQASDVISRMVGDELSKALGQPVIVENKPGAGGNIGSDNGAKAAPDGYTLTVATAALPISKHVRKLPFDPERDFTGVTLMTITPLVLVARPDLPVNSVRELVAYAKKNPGKASFASSGVGTSHQLSGELFKTLAGVDLLHVPYQGSAPAHIDIMGNRVDLMFDNIVPVTPHIQKGGLKALAVTTKTRASSLPNVPTMAESGFPEFEAVAWFGILAPAATPRPIIDRLNKEIVSILKRPAITEKLASMGAITVGNSPDEFQKFFKAEINRWEPIVKKANITVDQ